MQVRGVAANARRLIKVVPSGPLFEDASRILAAGRGIGMEGCPIVSRQYSRLLLGWATRVVERWLVHWADALREFEVRSLIARKLSIIDEGEDLLSRLTSC